MRQFFKFLFASCLGTLIALFVLVAIFVSAIGTAIQSAQEPESISVNSVLHLKFDQPLPELMDNVELTSLDPTRDPVLGLHDVVSAIETAAEDDDIKGIFLETSLMQSGFTSSTIIRDALQEFRASGKFIIAHAPYYSQSGYYLSSVADAVYLAPQGIVDFRGFSSTVAFYKKMLDKIGIDMAVFYAGEFKSATEPFRRTDLSPQARLQMREYLEGLYAILLERVSESRGQSVEKLREAANTYAGFDPQQAIAYGLIDGTFYREDVVEKMREKLGLEEDDEVELIKLSSYFHSRVSEDHGGDRIAVIIAEGTILDGKMQAGAITDGQYVELIDKVREDESVRAVVLRVNSPGGSASASDHIWYALERLQESGKPVIVSMGDYAASGGYYISCNADMIYAQPSTLTGSIGVYNIFPQAGELMSEKLGITFDTVKTADFSAALNPVMELNPAEKALLQNRADDLYRTFLQRVADGRGLTVQQVDSIARGRVWLGTRAVELGLVDRLGGLEDAIAAAAERSGLETYHTVTYPKPVDPLERLMKELFNDRDALVTGVLARRQLGTHYDRYREIQRITQLEGLQMWLPLRVDF